MQSILFKFKIQFNIKIKNFKLIKIFYHLVILDMRNYNIDR